MWVEGMGVAVVMVKSQGSQVQPCCKKGGRAGRWRSMLGCGWVEGKNGKKGVSRGGEEGGAEEGEISQGLLSHGARACELE